MKTKFLTSMLLTVVMYAPPVIPPHQCTAATGEESAASIKKNIIEFTQKLMRKKDLTGVSLALVDDQTVLLSEGFGWADKKNGIHASSKTVYQIGAVSKIFTALAVMKLREQGRISLDAPVGRYLPEFSIKTRTPAAGPLTIKSLLTEHSGLPSEFLKNMYTAHGPVPFNEYMEKAIAHSKMDYVCAPPDMVYANCNLGYGLLGRLVRNVSGESFADYTDRELFRAMGMQESSFSQTRGNKNLTKGYMNGKETPLFYINNLPAMSACSSADEMADFIKMICARGRLGGKQIISHQTLKAMISPQNVRAKFDADFKTGLGWQLGGYDLMYREGLHYDGPVIWRAGTSILNSAILVILPKEKLGVVVLCNTAGSMREVGDIALRSLNLTLAAKNNGSLQQDEKSDSPVVDLPPEKMKTAEGCFASEYIGFTSIRSTGEHLLINVMDHDIRLIPHADGSFTLKYYLLGFIPLNIDLLHDIRFTISDISGKTALLLLKNGKQYFGGIKIDAPEIPGVWKSRIGNYRIIDQGDDVGLFKDPQIIVKDGFLMFRADYTFVKYASIMLPLRPVSESECVVMGLGRNMGQTARFTRSKGKIRFSFSGLIMEKTRPD